MINFRKFVLFWFLILGTSVFGTNFILSDREYACEVTFKESKDTIIVGNLILGDSKLRQGALLISGSTIKKVGSASALREEHPDAATVDCGNSYISPGFINPHEHLNHSGGTPDPNTAPIYEHRDEWRGQIGDKYAVAFHPVSIDSRHLWIELRHLFAGTTTVASSGGVSELAKNAKSDHKSEDYAIEYEIFPFGFVSIFHDPAASMEDFYGARLRMSDEPQLKDVPYVAHIAEGTDATAALEAQRFMQSVFENPGRRYSLVHGVALNQWTIPALNAFDITLIWSPRSNVALYNATADIPAILEADGRVALSTDWSFSGSYNILEEIRCADHIDNDYWADRLNGMDYWHMITTHAAYALGLEATTGRIEANLAADLVIMRNYTGNFYKDLLKANANDVLLTFVDGSIQGGHKDAMIKNMRPSNCSNDIDSHFFCFEWEAGDASLSLDQLLKENRGVENVVPLFNTDSQVACKIDSEI